MSINLISSHSFDIPHYLATSSWVEHIPFAFDLVNKQQPKLVVELGVFNGTSYFAFCQALRAAKIPSACYGIDNWYGDEHTSFYNEAVFEKVNAYNNANYADFSTLIRKDFNEAVSYFKEKSIDLLHIDGLHTYEAVKNDFDTWLPKLSDSSIVLFHDISVRDRGFGVYKLWEELSAIYPSFSFSHGFGLGVLATGTQLSNELLSFFQGNEYERSATRAKYYRLGISFTEILKAEELDNLSKKSAAEIERLQARVIQLQEEVETLGAWGRRLDNELAESGQKLAHLRNQYDEYSGSNQDLRRQLEELNALRTMQEQREAQIALHIHNLLNHIEEATGRESTNSSGLLMENLSQLQEAAIKRQTGIQSLTEQNNLLNGQLSEKTAMVEALTGQIHNLSAQVEGQLADLEIYFKSNSLLKKDLEEKSEQIRRIEAEKKELESHRIYKLEGEKAALQSELQDIYTSDGYRLLSVYYRFKGKYLPEGSPGLRKLKAIGTFLKSKKTTAKIHGNTVTASSPQQAAQQNDFTPELPEGISFPLAFPIFEQPVVSIIIPAYNNWAFTRNCLISIYRFSDDVPYEIIVGDNVSTDETVNFEKYFTNVRYLRNKENLGYILNINNAASCARGEFILTLNNDTTVTKNWLISMINVMRKDEKVGLVGSKLVFPDGSLQEAGGIVWKDASGWNYGRGGNPEAPEYNYLKEVDYISGASNLVRKTVWEKLKGLDERYVPAYFDDSDLAFGIRQLGYKTIYQPLSVVIHYEGLTHGTSTSTGTKKYQALNAKKFVDKWRTVLDQQQFPNAENVFYARDRSRNKKTILVIDHYVPQFDKDAGSRTTFQYLELFTEMGFNVKFIGDNFYRHEPYTTILQQKGIEVLYGSYYAEHWLKWIEANESYIDFIFLNRPHISIKYIDALKSKMHGKILYYIHDLHFHRELMEYQVSKDPEKLKSAAVWKQTEHALFSKSDVVLTPSIKEKEIILADFPAKPVEVMPAFFYPSIPEPIRNFESRKDILFVGGFTHTPNVDAMLWFTGKIFPLIRKKNPDIRLIIVGSNTPDAIIKLNSTHIIIKGFATDEELNDIYANIRLSVIPLRYGAGLKGKTVEALAKGLPFISTSFGIEGLEDIDTIAVPFDEETLFAEAVISLYGNITRLEEISEASVSYARTHFTKEFAEVFFNGLFSI